MPFSNIRNIRVPTSSDRVVNDQCVVSFDSPFSLEGLFTNLSSWKSFGKDFLKFDSESRNCNVYLHSLFREEKISKSDERTPTRLAIGELNGFDVPTSKIIKKYSICVIKESSIDFFPCDDEKIPPIVSKAADAVAKHDGMKIQSSLTSWNADNEKIISKYAVNLSQCASNKVISMNPSDWKCEKSGDTSNLWLNLSTGYIGGGRRNWDGTGGSGAALDHFIETGKQYPLCVKLGTITAYGADVWSYADDEDCLVEDPLLKHHLLHWGIDMNQLQKTDKSMGEMEVDLNLKYDFSKITESNESLEPVYGPGLMGIHNIGSSCYLNSVLQILASLSEIQDAYLAPRLSFLETCRTDYSQDFAVQFSKLLDAILTNRYSSFTSVDSPYDISPFMFKHCVAQNNADFASGRQQDASEYLVYLLEFMERFEKANAQRFPMTLKDRLPTNRIFEFHLETRLQCGITQHVKYSLRNLQSRQNFLSVSIPATEDGCDNLPEAKKIRLAVESNDASSACVSFHDCLKHYFAAETIDYRNPFLGELAPTLRTVRMATFPKYLVVRLNRYEIDPIKLQVKKNQTRVSMPEFLDLNEYRGHGLQSGEILMAEEAIAERSNTSLVTADESLLNELVCMGFPENHARKGLIGVNNSSVDAALNWIFSNPDALNADDSSTSASPESDITVNPEVMSIFSSMGFSERQTRAAMKSTNSDPDRAMDWLFSHSDDLDTYVNQVLQEVVSSNSSSSTTTSSGGSNAVDYDNLPAFMDGEGLYSLRGFISHIGRNTDHGHYVCHIRKEGQWYIFNDEKVAVSKCPPLEYGFVYFYERNN